MDHETFFDLLKLIQVYVNQHLNVAYFSVLDETTINNQPGLRTLWSTREEMPAYTVDEESDYAHCTHWDRVCIGVVYALGLGLYL